jgi:hypothetical protein
VLALEGGYVNSIDQVALTGIAAWTKVHGAAMGVVLVRCPVTHRMFSTRIHLDREIFKELGQELIGSSPCPYCKVNHHWQPGDAMYVDAFAPDENGASEPESSAKK